MHWTEKAELKKDSAQLTLPVIQALALIKKYVIYFKVFRPVLFTAADAGKIYQWP